MTQQPGLGRLVAPDERDGRYPMSAVLTPPTRTKRYWFADGIWTDQGAKPHCVAHAWLHWLEDGPVTHPGVGPILDTQALYDEAQQLDEWEGTYDGTSVRAGAKALVARGFVGEYRWAFDAATVVQALLGTGPVVVGTNWYESMIEPGSDGVMTVEGDVVGGHAYLLDGVNTRTGVVRLKNSWSRRWGRNGFATLRIADLDRLIREDGEACLAIENQGGRT